MSKQRIISYAECGEDIVLYHALKDIVTNVTWVDAGASDPWEYSVTQMFYDRGGHGINVEPRKEAYEAICEYRKRDLNFCCGLGEKKGTLKFLNEATSASKDVIEQYKKSGKSLTYTEIPVRTLSDVLEEANINEDIHFFKIDVEGMEESVFKGTDFKKFRPWILCVESCFEYKNWEDLLLENGFQLAMVDEINRWYVSKEHHELSDRFKNYKNLRKIYDVHLVRRQELIDKLIKWRLEGDRYYKFGRMLCTPYIKIRNLLRRNKSKRKRK